MVTKRRWRAAGILQYRLKSGMAVKWVDEADILAGYVLNDEVE